MYPFAITDLNSKKIWKWFFSNRISFSVLLVYNISIKTWLRQDQMLQVWYQLMYEFGFKSFVVMQQMILINNTKSNSESAKVPSFIMWCSLECDRSHLSQMDAMWPLTKQTVINLYGLRENNDGEEDHSQLTVRADLHYDTDGL